MMMILLFVLQQKKTTPRISDYVELNYPMTYFWCADEKKKKRAKSTQFQFIQFTDAINSMEKQELKFN